MPPSREAKERAQIRLETVKAWIKDYFLTNYRPPSMTEIANEFKTSKQVVFLWICKLEDQKWIEPRGINQVRNIVPHDIAEALRNLKSQECTRCPR
jgi:hypothetical protein